MSFLLALPLLLALILLIVGFYIDTNAARRPVAQLSVSESVNRCFLAARLAALARICALIFILLLPSSGILTALGFAIGAFTSGFLAWRFPQRSYLSDDEDALLDPPPSRMAAGIIAASLALLSVCGYLLLLSFMTPSGQDTDTRPLWGLGLGASLAGWLVRIRPSTRWIAGRLCAHFPAHCQGGPVHPLVWFELLGLALILLASSHTGLAPVWAAAWLILSFILAALLVRRMVSGPAARRVDENVVFTLITGATLFLAVQHLYLPADMAQPWQNLLGPAVAGIVLLWLLLLIAGNASRYAGRLTLFTITLLILFISYGREFFGEGNLGYFLLGILSIAPIMYSLSGEGGPASAETPQQRLVALRFTQLVAAMGGLVLLILMSRIRYLGLEDVSPFYEALIPGGALLLITGILADRWLRYRDDQLLLSWSRIQPATPVNRHSREWPMLVRLGRRFTSDRLLPLLLVAFAPPAALLAGYPAQALTAVVVVLLLLLPRVIHSSLRYTTGHAGESRLFDLMRIALVTLFVLDPL